MKDIIESGMAWQGKTYCLTANYGNAYLKNTLERHQRTMIAEPVSCAVRSRYKDTGNRSEKAGGGTFYYIIRKLSPIEYISSLETDGLLI